MNIDIITIFPEVFEKYFTTSIIGRAQQQRLVKINIHDLRKFATDKHRSVDDKPYGGGPGMVMMAGPIVKAVDKIRIKNQESRIKSKKSKVKIILFSAKGKQFTQKQAQNYSKNYDQIIMICGRYEGIDERVRKILKAEEISIGPYVLTDGEVPAMLVTSAVTRLIPGAITQESLDEESFSSFPYNLSPSPYNLEHPHYTRPEVLKYKVKNYRVPKVLLSGHHADIKKWRQSKSKIEKKRIDFK